MSFWLKFVRDANLTANNRSLLEYSMALSDRYTNPNELNENDLNQLGILNQTDRIRLMEHARQLNEKVIESNHHLISIDILFCLDDSICNIEKTFDK